MGGGLEKNKLLTSKSVNRALFCLLVIFGIFLAIILSDYSVNSYYFHEVAKAFGIDRSRPIHAQINPSSRPVSVSAQVLGEKIAALTEFVRQPSALEFVTTSASLGSQPVVLVLARPPPVVPIFFESLVFPTTSAVSGPALSPAVASNRIDNVSAVSLFSPFVTFFSGSSVVSVISPIIVPPDTIAPVAPTLGSFFSSIIYTSSSVQTIFGTTTVDAVAVVPFLSAGGPTTSTALAQLLIGGQVAAVSSSVWHYVATAQYGFNYFYFVAVDASFNTSSFSQPAIILFDDVPPTIPLLVLQNQSSSTSTNIHLTVTSTDAFASATFFTVAYRTSSSWVTLANNSSSTTYDFSGVRGETYYFRAAANDSFGNMSTWSATSSGAFIFVLDTMPPSVPLINTSFTTKNYTTSSSITLFGTNSTDTVAVTPYYASDALSMPTLRFGIMPVVGGAAWYYSGALSSGFNYFYFTASDDSANTSTFSVAATVVRDADPPTAPLLAVDNQSSATSTIIRVTVTSTDAIFSSIYYDIFFRTSSDWIAFVQNSTSSTYDFSGSRGETYYFRARSADQLGNISLWSATTSGAFIFVPDTTPPAVPTLDSSFSSVAYTSNSMWAIFGVNSTDTVAITPYYGSDTISLPTTRVEAVPSVNGVGWSYAATLSTGLNYFYFTASDDSANTSSFSAAATFFFDATPPTIPTLTVINQSSPTSTNIQVSVTSSDVLSVPVFFEIMYRTSSAWTTLTHNSSSTIYNFSGQRGDSYLFQARAFDSLGNTSLWSAESVSYLVTPLDTAAPPVPTVLTTNQSSMTSTAIHIVLTGSDTFSPVTYYEVAYRTSSVSTTPWINYVSNTVQAAFDFLGSRGTNYYFRARATDNVGNISDWSVPNPTPVFVQYSGELVINEVAWPGTAAAYPNDQWLELYNPSSSSVDFSNWKISFSGRQLTFGTAHNTIIPAKGYYLLEASREKTVSDITSDIIYTVSSKMSAGGEKIELFKPSGEKVDEVDCSLGWFGGGTAYYRTMERLDPLVNGNAASNWQTNQGLRLTGKAFQGEVIYGSPKRSNFGNIVINYTQEDAVRNLTSINNPYILQYYFIPSGYTLNVGAGVVIKSYYSNAKIDVSGVLNVAGTTSSSVIFTSGRDSNFSDSAVAATVGSWSGSTPAAKDWQGLWFRPNSVGDLDGLTMRFAGKDFLINNYIYTGYVSQGLRAETASLTITNSAFISNGTNSIHLETSPTTVKNSTFVSGDRAIESYGSTVSIVTTTFMSYTNATGPLFIKDNWPTLSNVVFNNNTLNLPYVQSVSLSGSATITRATALFANNITIPTGSTLIIEPGATLNLAKYSTIDVKGSLQAVGTASEPITIQALGSGNNWGNISFNFSTSVLQFVNLSKGNLLPSRPTSLDGMLLLNDSVVTIQDTTIMDTRAPGNIIQITNSSSTIKNATIGQTVKSTTFATIGIKVNSGSTVHLVNDVIKNLTVGIYGTSNPLPAVDLTTMTSANFIGLDRATDPSSWLTQLLTAASP